MNKKQLRYVPLPPDTEHKLGKTGLYVWLNPPGNTHRDLREMAVMLGVTRQLLASEQPAKRGPSDLWQAAERLEQPFYDQLSLVLSQGPVDTHFSAAELAGLGDVVGQDLAEKIISDILSVLP